MSDLSVELQYGIPPFRLALPPGWRRRAATSVTEQHDLARAGQLFRQAGRPDLDAQYRALMRRARQGMAQAKVFAIYRQEDVELDELLPMSITASAVNAEPGATLDPWIADAFRLKGAVFLDDAPHIVRWASATTQPPGATTFDEIPGRTVTHAIPVPGSGRTKALVFTTTILQPEDAPITDETVDMLTTLSDLIVSTVVWEQAQMEPAIDVPAGAPRG